MYFVAKNISGYKLICLKHSNPYFFTVFLTVFSKIALFTETGSADKEQK